MITMLCSGSRGDIQPYIALAQQVKALHKDVRITAGKSFEAFVRGYGLDFYPLTADYQTAGIDPLMLKQAQNADNPLKMLLSFNKMKQYARYMTDEMAAACEGSEVVVYHPGCAIGYFMAEKLGIPSAMASPFPIHRTNEVASVIAYGRYPLPNGATYALLQNMLWMASKPGVEEFFGHKCRCPFERVDARHPSVISCSNSVFPRPADWNEHIHQTGYWFVEELHADSPPAALMEFINAGELPIYFGFGSAFDKCEQERFVQIIAKALRCTGRRGILCGMGEWSSLPKDVYAIESVSHAWLFPRMAAVCHHGGAGTTAAGFRAGIPSIVIPFSNDQYAWAHRAHDLGVGSKPIPKKKLTADALISAIGEALDPLVIEKARTLADHLAGESGVADCAKVIANLC